MSVSPYHSKTTGNDAVHPATYVGSSDPASPDVSVTADDKLWIDTTTGTNFETGWLLKIRSGGNAAWTTILDLSAVTVANDSITDAKLRNSTALSVIGRSANSTGDPGDIAAGSDGDILRRSGTTLGFGSVPVASVTGAATTAGNLSQFAATTSLQLKGVLSDETGSGAAVFATGPTLSAPLGIVENDIGASTHDAGNTSTAITVDWSVARTQKVTATGSATVTHSNMTAGLVYTLEYYTGAGAFTASFASTNFASGTAPTLTLTASKVDVFTFYKTIGGTIFGGVFGQSFAP